MCKRYCIILIIFFVWLCIHAGYEGFKNSKDVLVDNEVIDSDNRFIATGDKYVIDSNKYNVCFDSKTNIVYLVKNTGSYGNTAITVMYDSNGLPMTIEEYNKTR